MPLTTYVAPRPGLFTALIQASDLGGFRLEALPPLRVRDRYFDTDDGELLRRGFALRVRSQDGVHTASLRPLRSAADVSSVVPDVALDAEPTGSELCLPAGPLAALVERVAGEDPLRPLVSLRQYRSPRIAFEGGRSVALVSLDVVVTESLGEQVVSNEVEVEPTQDGTEADLRRLDPALRQHGVEPAERGKLERAVLRRARHSSQPLFLLPDERERLDRLLQTGTPGVQRRARTILLLARGFRPDTAGDQVGVSSATARQWQQEFRLHRTTMLDDAPAPPSYQVSRLVEPPEGAAPDAPGPLRAESVGEGASGDGAAPAPGGEIPDDLDALLDLFAPEAPTTPHLDEEPAGVPSDSDGEVPEPEREGAHLDPSALAEAAPPPKPVAPAGKVPASPLGRTESAPSPDGEPQTSSSDIPSHAGAEGVGPEAPDRFEERVDETDPPDARLQASAPEEPAAAPPSQESPAEAGLSAEEPEPDAPGPKGEPGRSPRRGGARPVWTGATPLLTAAHTLIAHHTEAYRTAAQRAGEAPDAPGARRLLLAAHRVRLSLDVFAPYLPHEATDRLRNGLRPVVRSLDHVLDLDRAAAAAPEGDVRDALAGALRQSLAALSDGLRGGRQQAWVARAQRLVDRLTAQGTDGLLIGDDFPPAPDDFVGEPGDVPLPCRLEHVVGSMLWARYEAIRAFEDEVTSSTSEIAYHLAIAVSALHFVLGLIAGTTSGPVREVSGELDALESDLASVRYEDRTHVLLRRAGVETPAVPVDRVVAEAWGRLNGPAFRARLAAVVAGV